MKKFGLLFSPILLSIVMNAQLKIDNATFFIGAGATVTVQGDVTSNVSIQGAGLLQLKGSSLQNIDMGGNTIPNLELDNTNNATLLNTNTRIGTSFLFTNGKFQTGNLNMIIGSGAAMTGNNAIKFFQTNGTGQLVKELTGDIVSYELPVGENNNYRPAYLTTTGGSYASASFGVRVLGTAGANKPPMIASYLNTNWPVTKSGIGGIASLSGQYIDPTDVQGTETNLRGYFNNGTDWSSAGETHDGATNRVGAPVTSASGVVSGMNKFIAVGAKAWLQGAYQSPTTVGLMNDALRTLPFGAASSTSNFPQDDPYRQAPYNATFTHVNNAATEIIPNSGVVAAQAIPGNSIVDWVFIELRNLNVSPGNTVLQTRSALIQRDGDIVDIDGVSPVTFNNVADGNYILTVRHRNHLGLSLDQGTPKNFTETKSLAFNAGKLADLMNAPDAELFGNSTAYTTMNIGGPTIRALWGGNANISNITEAGRLRYSAAGSDFNTIFSQVLAFPGNASGAYNYIGGIGYFSGDCNMNKNVRYSASSSDGQIILTNILSLSPAYNYIGLVQQIPN